MCGLDSAENQYGAVARKEPWPGKSRVEAIRIRLMKHGWTGLGLQACGQQNYSNLCILEVQLLVCQFPAPLTFNNQFLLDWSLLVDWLTDWFGSKACFCSETHRILLIHIPIDYRYNGSMVTWAGVLRWLNFRRVLGDTCLVGSDC